MPTIVRVDERNLFAIHSIIKIKDKPEYNHYARPDYYIPHPPRWEGEFETFRIPPTGSIHTITLTDGDLTITAHQFFVSSLVNSRGVDLVIAPRSLG
jgi:hypothetical protein